MVLIEVDEKNILTKYIYFKMCVYIALRGGDEHMTRVICYFFFGEKVVL